MSAATSSGARWRGLRALLIAIVLINAVTACAAPFHSSPLPAHPCCPTHSDSSSRECGKLGCFMSDPVTQPEATQATDQRIVVAVSFAAQVPVPLSTEPAPVIVATVASHDLFVAIHQFRI